MAKHPASIMTEEFSEDPWWWQAAAPLSSGDDPLPEESDIVVIGSGYAGLCCALELARGGSEVLVVDALKLGQGASTRNAGFLSGRAGVGKQIDLPATVGAQRAGEILDEAEEAFEHLQAVVEGEGIACHLQRCGRFQGAHTPKAYRKLEGKLAEYNSDGRNHYAMVPRAEQKNCVDSDFWYGGLYTENAGSIHPSLYHRGLLDRCRQAGVRFLSETRVLGVVQEGARKHLQTSRGVISAREVVLATNGYTDSVSPWHQKRLVPISSTAVATEPLGRERVEAILPKLCPVIDTKRVICFARPTPDYQAILFGGRARFSPLGPRESAVILHQQLCQMFPQLSDVKVTHAWSGYMAFTFDFLPKTGVQDGLHYAIGCNGGCGIVMMSWLGRQVARKLLGKTNKPSAFEGLPFKTQAFYSGKPWFLPVVGNWWRLRDWIEIRQAAMTS